MNANNEGALLFHWFAPYWFDAHSRLPGLEVGYQYELKQDHEVSWYIDVEILCYRYKGREIDQQRVEEYTANRAIGEMLVEEIQRSVENDAIHWLAS